MSQTRSSNARNRFPARRRFLKQSAALSAGAASISAPGIVLARANPASVKIGVLHPVTGALAVSGVSCRDGALTAIQDINSAGGIKSLDGARLRAVLGDARSQPLAGAGEIETMNHAGVCAIVGGYSSAICLAAAQAAARYGIGYLVDLGAADSIVERGLGNTFRFGPGHRVVVQQALHQLRVANSAAGDPAKSVMIVHEASRLGTAMSGVLASELPALGFEAGEVATHCSGARDFSGIVSRIKAAQPDVLILVSGYDESALLLGTMRRHGVAPMAVCSVLGGATSNPRFVREFPEAAEQVFDCNHGVNPHDKRVAGLRRRVEAKAGVFNREYFMNYTAMWLLADALERAASAKREDVIAALQTSAWAGHFMPYGPTQFVDGQNLGARPLFTQVQNQAIKVIAPAEFRQAQAVFPVATY